MIIRINTERSHLLKNVKHMQNFKVFFKNVVNKKEIRIDGVIICPV